MADAPLTTPSAWRRPTRGDVAAIACGVLAFIAGLAVTEFVHLKRFNELFGQYLSNGLQAAGVAIFLVGILFRLQTSIQKKLDQAVLDRIQFQEEVRNDVKLIQKRIEHVLNHVITDGERSRVRQEKEDHYQAEIARLERQVKDLQRQREEERRKTRPLRVALLAKRPPRSTKAGQYGKNRAVRRALFAAFVVAISCAGAYGYSTLTRRSATPPIRSRHVGKRTPCDGDADPNDANEQAECSSGLLGSQPTTPTTLALHGHKPPTSRSTTTTTLGAPPYNGTFALSSQRWNPSELIKYSIVLGSTPQAKRAERIADVADAIRQLHHASGLRFQFDGGTYSSMRSDPDIARFSTGDAQRIVVDFPARVPGASRWWATRYNYEGQLVGSLIQVPATDGVAISHEGYALLAALAWSIGLKEVSAQGEVMTRSPHFATLVHRGEGDGYTAYQAGDLTGLWKQGLGGVHSLHGRPWPYTRPTNIGADGSS